MGSKSGPYISGGEKKNLPSGRVTSNTSYTRRLYGKTNLLTYSMVQSPS